MTDYRYLKAFAVVAKMLSFKQAAQAMGISISAVSRQISLLEHGLKAELFIRNNRQLVLTPLGLRLAANVDAFETQLGNLNEEGPIRVGCLQSVFEFYFVELMKKHPSVFGHPFDIDIGDPLILQRKAESGQLDLLITNLDPSGSAVLSGIKLFQENVEWLGVKPKKLRDDRYIVLSAFEHGYSEAEREARNRIRINSFSGAVTLANHHVGRTLIAKPSQPHRQATRAQWIFAATPNYKSLPARIKKILAVMKHSQP